MILSGIKLLNALRGMNNSLLYGGYSCDSVESAPCAIYDRG